MDLNKRREYYQRCNPHDPLKGTDSQLYEPFDDAGLRGDEIARKKLLTTLRLSLNATTQLFSGLIGSGKSTELRRFAEEARDAGFSVAMCDVIDRPLPLLDRARELQVEDLLLAAAIAVTEAGYGPSSWQQAVETLWNTLSADIDVSDLSGKVSVGAASGLGKAEVEAKGRLMREPSVIGNIAKSRRENPLRFLQAFRKFFSDAAQRLQKDEKQLVIVLDGIEKISETEVEREKKEQAILDVFLHNPEFLHTPCHMIFTVPPFLIQYGQSLGDLYDSEPLFLPMVRIRKRDDRPDEVGIKAMLKALDRRVPIEDAFQSRDHARQLVEASGGVLRDLLRFLRECISACPEDCSQIDGDVVEKAISRVRRSYREAMLSEFHGPLLQTAKTKKFPLDEKNRPLFGQLLRAHMLLKYQNADEWYDVHPLIRDDLSSL